MLEAIVYFSAGLLPIMFIAWVTCHFNFSRLLAKRDADIGRLTDIRKGLIDRCVRLEVQMSENVVLLTHARQAVALHQKRDAAAKAKKKKARA